jgi:hypothetical protein
MGRDDMISSCRSQILFFFLEYELFKLLNLSFDGALICKCSKSKYSSTTSVIFRRRSFSFLVRSRTVLCVII